MKKIISITTTALLSLTLYAQELDCDCPDCRAKAEAAAAGKQFTLPGLEGLNKEPESNLADPESKEQPTDLLVEEHAHAHEQESCTDDSCGEACSTERAEEELSVEQSGHEEHVHGAACSHGASAEPVPHDHDGDGVPDHASHDDHEGHDHSTCDGHDDHAGHDHGSHDDHEGHDHSSHAGDDHGSCGGHGDHAEGGIELPEAIIKKIGLKILEAKGGTVELSSIFPAEIKLNRDRSASVSPRFPSIVRQVFAEIGDEVKKGDILASLENRETMAVYTLSAPQDGVIIGKDLAVGETAGEDSVLYQVADLSSVWADISIFPAYQHLVRKNTSVTFVAHDGHTAEATIKYISPIVSHETRTFTARCVLEGADEDFAPGAFVRAEIVVKQIEADVVVSREAVQRIDGESVVFVPSDHGFITAPVKVGTEGETEIEILSGLRPNDPYVAVGAFVLKAQMVTSGMDPHAGHGH